MVVLVTATDLRRSTAALYQSKWSRFIGWSEQQGINPCKASIPQVAEFFFYLRQELGLSVPVVQGYRAVLNHVFSLTEMDLAASTMVSWMFHSFEKLCPPREFLPPDWNLYLLLRCLSRPPSEPLKLASDKHLTWKTSFLIALAPWPRGLVRFTAFPFVFVTCAAGDRVPSSFFLTSWLRPRILLFLTLGLKSSRSRPWTILLAVMEVNFYSALSEYFVST